MTVPSTTHAFFLEIAKGNVDKHSFVLIRGHNADIDSAAEEDIWEAGGNISLLSAGETMNIVSTDANDTSAGTGARSVLVSGVDDTGAAITEVVSLNGITNVLTTNTFFRVNSMTVLSAGTSKHNEGNITATASTAATIQCEMDTTESLSQNSQYTVPLAKSAYLMRVEFNAAKISGGGGTPVVEFKGIALQNGVEYQLFDKKLDTAVEDELDVEVPIYSKIAAQTTIILRASTDTNNTEVRSRMLMVLVDD